MGSNVPPDESVFITEFESLKNLENDDVSEDDSTHQDEKNIGCCIPNSQIC